MPDKRTHHTPTTKRAVAAGRWLAGLVALLPLLGGAPAGSRGPAGGGGAVAPYIDPRQQTALPFGARSHWLQPWRAYSDTPPLSRLRGALGINLNVPPAQAEAVCAHLARSGFRLVRLEVGWNSVDYDHPDRLTPGAMQSLTAYLTACKRHNLRPLLLLNANHGAPCPMRNFEVHLRRPARKGETTVALDPADAARIVPGRSGLNGLTGDWAAEALFLRVAPDGTATLSKPLPKDLPAGPQPASTLRFAPFYSPQSIRGGGAEFEATLAGWLQYVHAVGAAARWTLGTVGKPDAGFDLEVWNELTFGSNFLDIRQYRTDIPAPPPGAIPTTTVLLARTVAYIRTPQANLPHVGICDGFNNQWPWGSGSASPPGLTALGKHPYAGPRTFPAEGMAPSGIAPIDALGRADGIAVPGKGWRDSFVPTYTSYFPEYFLTAIQTENLIRDISPLVSDIYGTLHGRKTHPAFTNGISAPAPGMWVTEVNLDPRGAIDLLKRRADNARKRGTTPSPALTLTPTDTERLRTKIVLRYLFSYANKGVGRLYFYAAQDAPFGLGLIRNAFYDALKRGAPGEAAARDPALTSLTMTVLQRLAAACPDTAPLHTRRVLTLRSVSDTHNHIQFAGDPRTATRNPKPHPPLYDRDCVAFFPFQQRDNAFVAGVYVMTRDLSRVYRPNASPDDPTRFDLPEERFRLTVKGLRATSTAQASLRDPLTARTVPVTVTARDPSSGTLTLDLPLTDSPRLLFLTDGH